MKRLAERLVCGGLALTMLISGAAAAGTTFPDVEPTNWAAGYIGTAVELKLLQGTDQGLFEPLRQVTYGEYAAMAARMFCPDEIPTWVTEPWWFPYTAICLTKGYLEGSLLGTTTWTQALADTPCTRQEMALILVNALAQRGITATEEQQRAAQETIPDWEDIPAAYQPAVAAAYSLGILCGNERGAFEGARAMTRAEAAKVLCVLRETIQAAE